MAFVLLSRQRQRVWKSLNTGCWNYASCEQLIEIQRGQGQKCARREKFSSQTADGLLWTTDLWCRQRRDFRLKSLRGFSNLTGREKLRVAIVGGGCAGLSAALHLAPLVEEGLIASPIDIFDCNQKDNKGRDIGVGLWTTALDRFGVTTRASGEAVYRDLTDPGKISTWVDHVGYRTPNGAWLMRSHLPENLEEHERTKAPGLLFMREKDLIGTLLKAVIWEEHLGTLKLHRNARSRVEGVSLDEWWSRGQIQHPWSAKLEMTSNNVTESSERDYHLIVAADGTDSNLRRKYGGHEALLNATGSVGTLSSPSMDVSLSSAAAAAASSSSLKWNEAHHKQAVGLQDRNYTVFRGNAPISSQQLNELDPKAKLNDTHRISFQTWGTGKSMRFATVPMFCPRKQQSPSTSDNSRQEHQVWFITVNDNTIAKERDPVARRDLLLEHFKHWHHPIAEIVRATDPKSILMERAIAHRHCMGPVINLNRVLLSREQTNRIPNARVDYARGPGPVLVFLGDAYMTVDPILAQGFTMAMEGSAALQQTLRAALSSQNSTFPPPLAFDPYVLRDEFNLRHEVRMDRLIRLLRVTELVQALGQPDGGSISGAFNTFALRPLTRFTPNFIKRPLFDAVLRYSLGL